MHIGMGGLAIVMIVPGSWLFRRHLATRAEPPQGRYDSVAHRIASLTRFGPSRPGERTHRRTAAPCTPAAARPARSASPRRCSGCQVRVGGRHSIKPARALMRSRFWNVVSPGRWPATQPSDSSVCVLLAPPSNPLPSLLGCCPNVFRQPRRGQYHRKIVCRFGVLVNRRVGESPIVDRHRLDVGRNLRRFDRRRIIRNRPLVVATIRLGHSTSVHEKCLSPSRDQTLQPFRKAHTSVFLDGRNRSRNHGIDP